MMLPHSTCTYCSQFISMFPCYHRYHENEKRVSILSLQSALKLHSQKSSRPQTLKSAIIDKIMLTPKEIGNAYEAIINLGHNVF